MFFFKKEKEPRNIREFLERASEEIETSGWVATAIFTSDGLKVFSKQRSPHYNVERIYPYAVKLFQTASKFHEKASPGLKVGGFEPPRTLIYQMSTKEVVFIVRGFSEKKEIFLIYIVDPDLAGNYSTDRTLKKLLSWIYRVSKKFDRFISKEK